MNTVQNISHKYKQEHNPIYHLRGSNFATKMLLCNIQYFYIVKSDMHTNNTYKN
jgi:hypothetical protein